MFLLLFFNFQVSESQTRVNQLFFADLPNLHEEFYYGRLRAIALEKMSQTAIVIFSLPERKGTLALMVNLSTGT